MNEKDFQYVLAVAKCKSFSQAAERLYLSQPALSRYIAQLEKHLGVKLFDRAVSPIQLTRAGKIFYSYAETFIEQEANLLHDLAEAAQQTSHPVRVGVPLVTGEYIFSRILPRMLNKYPHIQIDPIQDISDNLRKMLLTRQIDAAIICNPISDSSICSDYLFSEPFYLAGRRNHPALADYDTSSADAEHPLVLDFSTLKDVTLIHCKPISIMSYIAEEILVRMRFEPASEVKASSLLLALELAMLGVGFTSIMRCQFEYGHPNVRQSLCPISLGNSSIPFYLAYYRSHRRTMLELDLFIQETFSAYQDAFHI